MDLLYALAAAILGFMATGPPLVWSFVAIAIAGIPVILLHELGHAIAARRLLDGDVEVVVGTTGKLAELRLGRVLATINVLSHPAGPAGTVGFDDARATARDVLWIALAGPLASLLGFVATAMVLSAVPMQGVVHDLVWAAVVVNVFGVLNLIPIELRDGGGSVSRSDGRLALDALRALWALR